ncbi:MAG: chemotaxis protein CheW [Spirochaetes bacterium]|nr:chemotaxis protein CheW [Spirochaetota bacterium]
MSQKEDSDVRVKNILRERAKKLAAWEATEAEKPGTETLILSVGNETYGIESKYIREVEILRELTPLPHVPAFVLGIVNHHGVIRSVIDLHRFFGLEGIPLDEYRQIVFIHSGMLEFGIAVSHVKEAVMIPTDKKRELPDTLKEIAGFIRCITQDQIALLDIEQLCTERRLIVYQEA